MDVSHNFREDHTARFDVLTFWQEERFFFRGTGSGGSRGGTRGGRGGLPLIFRPNWRPKGQKIFFETAPPPYLRVWMIPPLSEGLYPPPQEPITRRHWVDRLIEFRFEILVTGSPLLSSRRFSTVHADFIARSLFRSSALTAYAKTKDPFKKISLQKCSNIMK